MKQKFSYGIPFLLVFIGLIAGVGIGYLFFKESGDVHAFDDVPVRQPEWNSVTQSKADSNMKAYRKDRAFIDLSLHRPGKSCVIVHEPETALNYDKDTFPDFVKYHTPKPGYKWSIGLYPEICRDTMHRDNKVRPRISVFMIPTMRNKDIEKNPHDIIDYYATIGKEDAIYYLPDTMRNKSTGEIKEFMYGSGSGGYTFDQGTIFP